MGPGVRAAFGLPPGDKSGGTLGRGSLIVFRCCFPCLFTGEKVEQGLFRLGVNMFSRQRYFYFSVLLFKLGTKYEFGDWYPKPVLSVHDVRVDKYEELWDM